MTNNLTESFDRQKAADEEKNETPRLVIRDGRVTFEMSEQAKRIYAQDEGESGL